MKKLVLHLVISGLVLWFVSPTWLAAQPTPPPPAPAGTPAPIGLGDQGDQGEGAVEVLTRGPIHEAFAEPVNSGSVEPIVIPKQPPEPVQEIPPDVRPEGENVAWIGGYWAWDDDRQDFIWISGVWRVAPPGRQWVAGYWAPVDGGSRWAPGFWSPTESQEVTYMPDPPASLEQGPTGDPLSAEHFWVPGCWTWREVRYVWRPGYWAHGQADWVWTPDSYYWSPPGWVLTQGFWDYAPVRRGLAFCPVRFTRPVWHAPTFYYTPQAVVDLPLLTLHLFARPVYNHYYFGDYYAPRYADLGIYPWFAVRQHRHYAYDPLFTYQRWSHRSDPRWGERQVSNFRYYRDHEQFRPPHTLVQQQQFIQKFQNRRDVNISNVTIATNVQELRRRADRGEAQVRLRPIEEAQRRQFADLSRELRQSQNERRKMEMRVPAGAVATAPGAKPRPTKLERPERARMPKSAELRLARVPQASDARTRPDEAQRKPGRLDTPSDSNTGRPNTDRLDTPGKPAMPPGARRAVPAEPRRRGEPDLGKPDMKPDVREKSVPPKPGFDGRPELPPRTPAAESRAVPRTAFRPNYEPGRGPVVPTPGAERPPLPALQPGSEPQPGSVRPGIGRGSTQPVRTATEEAMPLPRPQRDLVSPTQPRQPSPAPGWSGGTRAARPDGRDVEVPRGEQRPLPPPTIRDVPLQGPMLPGPRAPVEERPNQTRSTRGSPPVPAEREAQAPRARPAPPPRVVQPGSEAARSRPQEERPRPQPAVRDARPERQPQPPRAERPKSRPESNPGKPEREGGGRKGRDRD